jgi:hypothetical protein
MVQSRINQRKGRRPMAIKLRRIDGNNVCFEGETLEKVCKAIIENLNYLKEHSFIEGGTFLLDGIDGVFHILNLNEPEGKYTVEYNHDGSWQSFFFQEKEEDL